LAGVLSLNARLSKVRSANIHAQEMFMQPDFDQPGHRTQQPSEHEVPELDAKLQGLLGRALQAHYDDLINAPVPDRFLLLLAELEAKEKRDE